MSTAPQYEFTNEQNAEIGNLAGKMRFVGFFSVAFGVLALLICLMSVLYLFSDQLPKGFRDKVKDYYAKAKDKVPEEISLEKIPKSNDFLTGVAVFAGVTGLIFFLQGIWTRSAGGSFQKIVDTKGDDVNHLMSAIGSLRAMYGQVYLLLMAALLGDLLAVGLTVYHYFGH